MSRKVVIRPALPFLAILLAALPVIRLTGVPARASNDFGVMIEFYRDADKRDQAQRMRAYTDALEQIYNKYPDDPDAEIFYGYAVTALRAGPGNLDRTISGVSA